MNNNHIQLSFPTELCSYLISGRNPKVSEVCFRIFLSQRMPNTTAIVVDFANSRSMQAMLQQFFPTVFYVNTSCDQYMSLFTEDGYESIDKIYRYFEQTGLEELQRDSMKHCLKALEEISILQGNGRLTKANYLRLHTATAMTDAVKLLTIQGKVSPSHANDLYAVLAQSGRDLLPLEHTLASMEYHNQNAVVQSVADVPAGCAALFSVSQAMNTKNTQLIRQLKTDISYRAKRGEPLLLIFNAGTYTSLSALKDLLAEMQYQYHVKFMYITPDVFSSSTENESTEQFLNMFQYNIFSRHGGESAQKLSRLFGERLVYESSHAETKDLRLSSASITDLLLHRNRSITTSYSPSMRPYLPASWIMHLEGGILYNTATKEYTFL